MYGRTGDDRHLFNDIRCFSKWSICANNNDNSNKKQKNGESMNAIQGQANKNKAKKVYSQDPSLCEQLYSFTLTTSTQFSSTLPVPQKKQTLSLFRGKSNCSNSRRSISIEWSVFLCLYLQQDGNKASSPNRDRDSGSKTPRRYR